MKILCNTVTILISLFFSEMRKYKVCYLCPNSTTKNPDLSFFHATEHIVKSLHLPTNKDLFICEVHFVEKDIKRHGVKKRLNPGALPTSFPKKDAFLLDHGYFCTTPLDLVCISLINCFAVLVIK